MDLHTHRAVSILGAALVLMAPSCVATSYHLGCCIPCPTAKFWQYLAELQGREMPKITIISHYIPCHPPGSYADTQLALPQDTGAKETPLQ